VKVALTVDAASDLEEIAEHIAKDAPRRALSFVRELRQSALALARSPTAYPFASRFERLGVRRRVHGNYLILYRVEGDRLDILRIVHGARDYARLLEVQTSPP
jgi:plasmid stabilization system protein ParE